MAFPAAWRATLVAALLAPLALTGCDGDNSSLSVSGDGDDSLRGASTPSRPSADKSDFSLSSPDPRTLVWDSVYEVDNVTRMHGWLRAPLDHDSAKPGGATPHVCLRVSVHARSAEPRLGPLLMHCGGPGSGRDCPLVTNALATIEGDFAFLGVDQRGVSLTPDQPQISPDTSASETADLPAACPFVEQSGGAVPPFPAMRCDSLYERLANLSYDDQAAELRESLSHFLGDSPAPTDEDMDVIFALLQNGGLPSDGVNGVSYLDETYVRWYYRLLSLESNLCVVSPRFQRTSPSGRVLNVLEFAGTADLARDIELFRRAVGADKMSLAGYSYGTTVAPTYATLFPERVGRMVLDAVAKPSSNLLSHLTPYSKGFFSVFQGIMTDCSSSLYRESKEDNECPLAPGPSSKVLQMINDKTNLTRASAVANLFLNSLTGILLAPLAVDYAARAYAGEAAPEWCEKLPQFCHIPAPPHRQPIGPSRNGDRFSVTMLAGVWASDTAGRLGEESFISWWRGSVEEFPLGTWRAVSVGAALASWPLYSKPLPPPGKSGMPALIIGNLHDAQTDYVGAQAMRAAYPDAALMTWQGYGHALPADAKYVPFESNATFQQNEIALQACRMQVFGYLNSGKLPRDGYVCALEEPLALGRSAVDEVLSLMSSAR